MNIKFAEIEIDWPSEIKVVSLKKYILSRLRKYGEPLRWAISSVSNPSEKCMQKISIEAVFLISKDDKNGNNSDLI